MENFLILFYVLYLSNNGMKLKVLQVLLYIAGRTLRESDTLKCFVFFNQLLFTFALFLSFLRKESANPLFRVSVVEAGV